MARQRRKYFAAGRWDDGEVKVEVFDSRDAAEVVYDLFKWADARKVCLGSVPAGIAKRTDAAAVIRENLRDRKW